MNPMLILIVSLILVVFFSGIEVAFVSANKLRIEIDKKQDFVFSGLITLFTRNSGQFVATTIVGSTLSMVVLSLSFFRIIQPVIGSTVQSQWLSVLLQIGILSVVLVVFGELVPGIIFRINPNGFLKFLAIPIAFFYFLFYPFTRVATSFSAFLLRILSNVPGSRLSERKLPGRADLDLFVHEAESSHSGTEPVENEVKLFRNALDFSKVRLREIMVPRTEMIAMDIDSTIDELQQKFIETGYSRILFYDGSIDNIVGYIHHSVIFSKPDSVRSQLRKVLIVPESMSASKLLSQFIQQRLGIAVVVDEFGGTSGMVTTEDILEEIFGEIEDEHDTIDLIKKQISSVEYVFSGRLELDELNEQYNLGFPESENFETLAGFILYNHESIPKINTIITIGAYRFKVLKATNTKIELVHLKLLDEN